MKRFFKFASLLAIAAMLFTATPAISQTGPDESTTQNDRRYDDDDGFDFGWLGLLGLLGLFGLRRRHDHDIDHRTTTTPR